MNEQIKCKHIELWKKDGVLFSKFMRKNGKKEFSKNCLAEYLNAITTLSNGRYLPLIIDLRKLKDKNVFSLIEILAKDPNLKSAILSKSFIINSRFLHFILVVLRMVHDPIIPNKVFISDKSAMAYSLKTNHIFNAR